MTKPSFAFRPNRLASRGWLLGLCGFSACAFAARAQYDPEWVRNFRVGAVVGFNVKADFRVGNQAFNVNNGHPGTYDDGYVIPDPQNTANPFTSNWGYESADQFDADAQTLTLHRTTSFIPTGGSSRASEDLMTVGFDMEYGGYPWRWDRVRLGWNFGFAFLPISSSRDISVTGEAQRTAFTFNTHSSFFPEPGYHGQPGGDGFNLDSTIVSETPETLGDNVSLRGRQTLDVTLFAFRLGPSIFWDLHPSLGLAVGAGPAVGFITGEYRFNDTIALGDGSSAENRGSFDATEFVYGGYVNATLTYHATLNGDFYLGAQYMPLGSAEFSKNGRSAKLDLSGAVFISAGINWPF